MVNRNNSVNGTVETLVGTELLWSTVQERFEVLFGGSKGFSNESKSKITALGMVRILILHLTTASFEEQCVFWSSMSAVARFCPIWANSELSLPSSLILKIPYIEHVFERYDDGNDEVIWQFKFTLESFRKNYRLIAKRVTKSFNLKELIFVSYAKYTLFFLFLY